MIVLDRTSYVNSGINSINVDAHRDLDRPLTHAEITNLRQHAAALSKLQSKISQPTLKLIKETDKLVSGVKLNETHLTIHPDT